MAATPSQKLGGDGSQFDWRRAVRIKRIPQLLRALRQGIVGSGQIKQRRAQETGNAATNSICVVAILKDEEAFVEEWVSYHRLLGVDHFYLYDNDSRQPLRNILARHAPYVTIVEWLVEHDDSRYEGRNKQVKAYTHFVENFGDDSEWVAFIDGDEFIVLDEHADIREFLSDFATCDSIALNWYVFGHNGYYERPAGLITECLTRRMKEPRAMVKSISRTGSIASIRSAHLCELLPGSRRVDANKRTYKPDLYPGKTQVAHINHYQCRSFVDWMNKPVRGEVGTTPDDPANAWRFTEEGCLRQFVTQIALDKNEHVDTSMVRYAKDIKDYLARGAEREEQGTK